MPSWNIHMALSDAVLEYAPQLSVDPAVFVFGNLVPDIYVGYMVPNVSKHIDYETTHFADPDAVPIPDYEKFWQEFGASGFQANSHSLSLGAYVHLIADAVFNAKTQEFLHAHHIERGECARMRKQQDFAVFGKTLKLAHAPALSEKLIHEANHFAQYSITEFDVMQTIKVAQNIFNTNNKEASLPDNQEAIYCMLTKDFFENAFSAALECALVNVQRIDNP